jgi:two-component system OmpR family response regulator
VPASVIMITNARDTANLLQTALSREGFEVLAFKDSDVGMKNVYAVLPDVVIMEDRMSISGSIDFCHQIRQLPPIAIILLGDEEAGAARVVNGLERGADFYMRRPISCAELTARVKSVLRRRPSSLAEARHVLDTSGSGAADRNGRSNLTPTEFRLLAYMAVHKDRVIPTEELLGSVWAGEKVRAESVKFHISQLRHKLNHASPQSILNHWGMGYRLAYEKGQTEAKMEVSSKTI